MLAVRLAALAGGGREPPGLLQPLSRTSEGTGEAVRTQLDLPMRFVTFGIVLALVLTFLFFHLDVMGGNWTFSIVAILVVSIITFLFTTVAANAIAIVGTNPVSGMTLMTLILASVVMVAVGLSGTSGMVAALIMGGVVCTALSMAGGFVTDLKIGYWLGSTPRKQETWKFLGTLVSAATVAGVIMILNKTYGFTDGTLSAPQANAMAAVIEPLMSGNGAPWLLYGIGALIALVLNAFGVSALAFALGMFIPLELNLPLLVGGAINWFVTTRSKDQTGQQCPWRAWHPAGQRLHRRRCPDGCAQCRAEVAERQLRLQRLVAEPAVRNSSVWACTALLLYIWYVRPCARKHNSPPIENKTGIYHIK